MSEEARKAKVRQRGGVKATVTSTMKSVEQMLKKETDLDPPVLRAAYKKLEHNIKRLYELDAEVLGLTDGAAVDAEVTQTQQYNDGVLSVMVQIEECLITPDPPQTAQHPSAMGQSGDASSTLRLPKFEMAKFSGDPMQYQSFSDVYKAAIHDNRKLNNVEKFTYLLGYLEGEPLTMISGFALTADNYQHAFSAIEERYGNKQRAQSAHFLALISLEPARSRSLAEVRRVFDQCEVHIRSLVALGLAEDTFAVVFTSLILSKLPDYLSTKLMEKTGKDDWSLSKFREWIGDDIRAREIGETNGTRGNQAQGFSKKSGSQQTSPSKAVMSASSLAAPGGAPRSGGKQCAFCDKTGHWAKVCRSFPSVEDRVSRLKETRGCFNCLKGGHRSADCEYAGRKCTVCGRTGHHISICRSQESGGSSGSGRSWPNKATKSQNNKGRSENRDVEQSTPKKTEANVTVAEKVDEQVDTAFLQTAVAKVERGDGSNAVKARLLMDTASSRTYVTESLRDKLSLESIGRTHISVGRFGTSKRATRVVEKVKFDVVCQDGKSQPVLAIVVPVITCPISYTPVDLTVCRAVQKLTLAEPLKASSASLELDILIGSDQYYNFVRLHGSIADECGLVFLNSRLGYLTAGTMPIEGRDATDNPESTLALLRPEVEKEFLSHECEIERFWQVEEVGAMDKKDKDVSDEEALQRFEETVQFRDGRYHVTWPWKSQEPELQNNYGLAYGRLKSTLTRLQQDKKLMSDYNDIIMKQAERGYIEKSPEKPEKLLYYLPHHPVFKPESRTTKIRIVYDASSKARKHFSSLNDCLHQGPVILDDLIGLLIRFRTNKIALVSDIEKAFWQIRLQQSERDVTRFLWVNDVNKPPTGKNVVHWRFTSVFFGAISSPFLLGATINHHLRKAGGPVATKIIENLYVDNVITGENDEESATNYYREAKSLFLGVSMNLREFFTNSTTVREKIAPEDRGNVNTPKVLGVVWDVEKDSLQCAMKSSENEKVLKVTKRVVAQQTAELWDPCGWYAPVVLTGKLLYQQVWQLGLDWNAPVPDDIVKRLCKVRKEYLAVTELSINRYLGDLSYARLELHTFCDSSKLASGVAVYLRIEQKDVVTTHLLMGKTRLASVNSSIIQTIPRLELIALVMGVHATEFVSEQLRLPIVKKTVWSDSHCVLYWLTKEKLATKFVERRVNIVRAKQDICFRYVPSEDNPADLASRGCKAMELAESSLWWTGPSWLVQSEDYWPKNITERMVEPEEKVEDTLQLATVEVCRPSGILDIQRYSSLHRLLRVTAYVIRFSQNLRKPSSDRQCGVLTVRELSHARKYWEQLCQAQGFPELQGNLSAKVLKKSPVRQLNVFRDDEGLLRCAGRLTHAAVSFDVKNPVLLPKNHPFTNLAVRESHVVMGHAGVAQTLAQLRQRYWVLHGRSQVKRAVRSCNRCRRVEGGPYRIPAAPALPDFRVKDDIPFTSTGLDYLGFLHVMTGPGETAKVWVCLFTCAASRAVHLELVENQSAEEFHLALRRFFALYGCPKLIVSDNASQFVSVETAMKRLWNQLSSSPEGDNLMTTHHVEWKKIPEVAPWMGGFYERLVGTVKKFLKKLLDGVCVGMSEMRTVLAEITTIVNSRPLLYVEDDVSSTPLCPLDLLGKSRRGKLPTFNESEGGQTGVKNTPDKVVSSWKRLQALTSSYWNHWREAYLTSLREKHANATQRNPSDYMPSVDSVVQIKDKVPRAQWRLGKIVKLFPSADGKIRSVQLRVANGQLLTRPVKLLYPLEMHTDRAENAVTNRQNPFSVSVDHFESENESDFEFFSSADIAQAEKNLEKFDELERAIVDAAKNAEITQKAEPRPRIPRKRRQKALAAQEKIRQALNGGSSPNSSWWESSEESE